MVTLSQNNLFAILQLFVGNSDGYGVKQRMFPQPVQARFIRIAPQTWSQGIAMRIELLGCREKSVAPPTLLSLTKVCKGVNGSKCPSIHACYWLICDGKNRLSANDCPRSIPNPLTINLVLRPQILTRKSVVVTHGKWCIFRKQLLPHL